MSDLVEQMREAYPKVHHWRMVRALKKLAKLEEENQKLKEEVKRLKWMLTEQD